MSPFWKNVDEEIRYLNMNLKTLANISGVPYPTITNGRNRENSIPEIDTAKKIAAALHKPLESLLGTDITYDSNPDLDAVKEDVYFYKKYKDIIEVFEKLPIPLRESLRNTVLKFYETYEIMKNKI